MFLRKGTFYLIFLGFIFLLSCTSDYSKELGHNYFLVIEGGSLNKILNHQGSINGVPPALIRYNYNEKFIIAEQKPRLSKDVMHENDIYYKHGKDSLYYWIIIKKSNRRIGPMDQNEFEEARKKHEVPKNLKLENP